MNTHADKTQENKNQSAAHATSQKQSDNTSAIYLEDNRPKSVAQLKLQEATHNSTSQQPIQRAIYESGGQWYSNIAGGPFRNQQEARTKDLKAGGDGHVMPTPQARRLQAPQHAPSYGGGFAPPPYSYSQGLQQPPFYGGGSFAPPPYSHPQGPQQVPSYGGSSFVPSYGGGYGSQAPRQAAPPVLKPQSKRLLFVDPSSKEGKQALAQGQQRKEREKAERAAAKEEAAREEAAKPENIALRNLEQEIDDTTTIVYSHSYGSGAALGHEWSIMKGGKKIGVYHYHPNPAEGGDSSPESIKVTSSGPKSYSIPQGFKVKALTDLADK